MTKKEILKKMLGYKNRGLFTPANLFNGIGQGESEKEIHELISEGCIDEVSKLVGSKHVPINHYRLSEKGIAFGTSFPKKVWFLVKKDIRTTFISGIVTIITTIITIKINKALDNSADMIESSKINVGL